MFDVVTYALLKKAIASAATGIEKIEYANGELIITTPDGNKISTPLDIAGFGAENVSFDENTNSITFIFDDETKLTFSAPSRQEFENQEENIKTLQTESTKMQEKVSSLEEAHQLLQQHIDSFGFSVVNGQLNVTYEEEETL